MKALGINLNVNQEELEKMRAFWSKRHVNPVEYDFSFYYTQFSCGVSFTNIAKKTGRTVQNVCRIYETYFKNIFGISGRDLHSKVLEAKRTKKEYRHFKSAEMTFLRTLIRHINKMGLLAEPVPIQWNNRTQGRFRKDMIKVNEKTCRVHRLTKAMQTSPTSKRFYIHAKLSRRTTSDSDFTIIICDSPSFESQIFIIPNCLLFELHFAGNDKTYYEFYIPVERYERDARFKGKIDFWEYEGAWHLLK